MSDNFVVNAEARVGTGTAASRQARRAGKVPSVLYGGGGENQNLFVDHNAIRHQLDVEAFHSAIIDLHTDKGVEQAILREVHVHPHKPQVLHIDFQRVSAKEKLHMSIPVHTRGQEESPGVKHQDGIVSHLMNDVEISCLPADLPEYLEVDISGLSVGESVHLSDIKVPEGVEIVALANDAPDAPVASVLAPKVEVEPEPEEIEGVEGLAEGEEAGEGESGDAEAPAGGDGESEGSKSND
jgi:large subunit ribosomal protein L25